MLAIIKLADNTLKTKEDHFSITRAPTSPVNNNKEELLILNVGLAEDASDFVAFMS